jgi:transcriptional regulator with XRE-family HTH domain
MGKIVKIKKEQVLDIPNLEARLEAARVAKGLSVSALCRVAEISRDYWYDIVNESLAGAVSEQAFRRIEAALEMDFGVKFD